MLVMPLSVLFLGLKTFTFHCMIMQDEGADGASQLGTIKRDEKETKISFNCEDK